MKNFNQLTEKELFNLTDEQVENYIKLEYAEKGIKLLNPPLAPKYQDVEEGDKVVFSTGILGDRIVFEKHADAQKVIDLFKELNIQSITGDYNLGETKYYLQEAKSENYRTEKFDISSRTVLSANKYKQIKDILKSNSTLKKDFEAKQKEYQAYVNETKEIKEGIYSKVREAHEKYNTLNHYCELFKNDYLPLAEGKKDVAMKFLNKAYGLNEEAKNYVLDNFDNKQD